MFFATHRDNDDMTSSKGTTTMTVTTTRTRSTMRTATRMTTMTCMMTTMRHRPFGAGNN
jgi:hypothetical protein